MDVSFFLLAAFGAMVCWGLADFTIQRSVRKVGDLEALAFIGLIGAVGLLPFILSDLPLLLQPQNLFYLALIGIIDFVVAMFTFEAFKKGKLSVVEVLLEIELPITILVAFLLCGDIVSPLQLVFIIPIFIGIILMAVKSKSILKHGKHFLEKGALLAVLAAVGMGLVNSLMGFSARSISPLMVVWLPWVLVCVISLIFIARDSGLKKTFSNASKYKWLILVMGIVDTAAWVFYAFAMESLNIGVVTGITESYPVVGLILGIFINRERIVKHQLIGAALTIIASVALAITLL